MTDNQSTYKDHADCGNADETAQLDRACAQILKDIEQLRPTVKLPTKLTKKLNHETLLALQVLQRHRFKLESYSPEGVAVATKTRETSRVYVEVNRSCAGWEFLVRTTNYAEKTTKTATGTRPTLLEAAQHICRIEGHY